MYGVYVIKDHGAGILTISGIHGLNKKDKDAK